MQYYVANNELYHYGVKGMKWGVRRYQNADGTLTSEGRKRARQEYKQDNKLAFELGRQATLYGYATAKSMKRTIKLENKLEKQFDKDPEANERKTKTLRQKWAASAKTTAELAETYRITKDEAEQHCNMLMDKYGKEAVSKIKYSDLALPKGKYSPGIFRSMDERTASLSEYAAAGAVTVASMAAYVMGAPFLAVAHPSSTIGKASDIEERTYLNNRRNTR